MRVKMLTARSGADIENNWREGQIMDVSPEEANVLVNMQRVAVAIDEFPVVGKLPEPEKAVIEAPEVRRGKGGRR